MEGGGHVVFSCKKSSPRRRHSLIVFGRHVDPRRASTRQAFASQLVSKRLLPEAEALPSFVHRNEPPLESDSE